MSCRHAVSATHARAMTAALTRVSRLGRNVGYSQRIQVLEELPGRGRLEARIGGFDDQEEPVGRGARKRFDVEHRMVRLRELVERPHAEERGERRPEYGGFEGHWNELRPADERPPTHVERIRNRRHPRLEREAAGAAE